MKVTIILLTAVVCFAAINAAPSEKQQTVDLPDDELFLEEMFADEAYELQLYNIFSPFFWYLKAALRTLKGVNCSIKEAIRIKTDAELLVTNLQNSGADAVKAFANVIASCKKVIDICNKIINLNEKVCKTDESTNENKSTTWSCVWKLFKQLYMLRNEICKTLQAIKEAPAAPGDAAYCTKSAVNALVDAFKAFPANVKMCSKLKN